MSGRSKIASGNYKNSFVVCEDILYVRACLFYYGYGDISMLCGLTSSGISCCFLNLGSGYEAAGPFVTIDKAIDWVREECRTNPKYAKVGIMSKESPMSGYEVLEALQAIKEMFIEGGFGAE